MRLHCKEHGYIDEQQGACPYCRITDLEQQIAIALREQPELDAYSKAAGNFHDAWVEERDKNTKLVEALEKIVKTKDLQSISYNKHDIMVDIAAAALKEAKGGK